ncbi:uncharacterized protein [Ptychodera flava]|uniref:uncharacterized protein n=1 Tax=Ptychodera flava TaxID=63121 RepID=UPI00396A0593
MGLGNVFAVVALAAWTYYCTFRVMTHGKSFNGTEDLSSGNTSSFESNVHAAHPEDEMVGLNGAGYAVMFLMSVACIVIIVVIIVILYKGWKLKQRNPYGSTSSPSQNDRVPGSPITTNAGEVTHTADLTQQSELVQQTVIESETDNGYLTPTNGNPQYANTSSNHDDSDVQENHKESRSESPQMSEKLNAGGVTDKDRSRHAPLHDHHVCKDSEEENSDTASCDVVLACKIRQHSKRKRTRDDYYEEFSLFPFKKKT